MIQKLKWQQYNNVITSRLETISEFYGPGMRHHEEALTQLWDENGEEIEAAPHAMMICKMKVSEPVKPLGYDS